MIHSKAKDEKYIIIFLISRHLSMPQLFAIELQCIYCKLLLTTQAVEGMPLQSPSCEKSVSPTQ